MESGVFHTDYRTDMGLRRVPAERIRLGLFAAALLVFPFLASPYWLNLANQIAIATIGALGLNILVGYTGQVSLGQGAFMAVGAYTSALLTLRLGLPWGVSIVAACFATAAVGVFFGLPSLRLKGLYLAISTLAAQEIVEWVVTHWPALTGGVEAVVVPAPRLFGQRLNTDFGFYWLGIALAGATALFTANLFRSRIGRSFVAVRDQDIAASVIGVNVFGTKLLAFATSSFFVGLAGALTAYYRNIISWERFTLETSVLYLAMIIVGGLGTIRGSLFGAALITLLPATIATVGRELQGSAPAVAALLPSAQQAAFGLVIILFLVFEPEGLSKLWRNVKDYFYVWPFAYRRGEGR
ncbi:MAG: branched-chain amino acid ABC transporter permease [Gemmatimonadota bacterium]|uniref:branched-chain amino acid ABC transporter permease n=1 Tax=Candidatus Palauibacter scopulicola TaxID=3056741 RepID=UPI00238A6F56|nr:branched-chain amino acid ABC transporter permease [Candidatus Palauibacter scopulicola]MDE2664475.1 branched-chain amino acid ABC transporter permease [Candidatus Palauibacter scopulicola]